MNNTRIVLLVVIVLALALTACEEQDKSSTGSFFDGGTHTTFEILCDMDRGVGMWAKAYATSPKRAAGFAMRMTDAEFELYCYGSDQ